MLANVHITAPLGLLTGSAPSRFKEARSKFNVVAVRAVIGFFNANAIQFELMTGGLLWRLSLSEAIFCSLRLQICLTRGDWKDIPPERSLGRIPENHQLQFRWEVFNVTDPEDGRV